MKTNRKELDVDFIGSQDQLTKEEEKEISDFIQLNKEKKSKSPLTAKRASRKKTTV